MGSRKKLGKKKPSYQKAVRAYKIIRESPGIYQYALAKELGYKNPRSGAESLLCGCNFHGMLLSEDESGGLYVFEEAVHYSLQDQERWR